jgi:CHAT domain-containing protein
MLPLKQQQENHLHLDCGHKERWQLHLILSYIAAFMSVIVCLIPFVTFAETVRESGKQIPTNGQTTTDPVKQRTAAKAEQLSNEASSLSLERTHEAQQQAIVKYEEALQLYLQIGDKSAAARTLSLMASVLERTPEAQQQAIVKYEEALQLYLQVGDKSAAARTLSLMAIFRNSSLKQPLKALDTYNQALKLWQAERNSERQIFVLQNIADIYVNLEQYQAALSVYEQALKIVGTQKNLTWLEVSILGSIARVNEKLKKFDKALIIYQQIFEAHQARKDLQEQIFTLQLIIDIYEKLKNPQKVLTAYKQLLTINNQLLEIKKDKKALEGQIITLSKIAMIYEYLKEPQKELVTYNQSIVVHDKLLEVQKNKKDLEGQIKTLESIAKIYRSLKETQKELDTYNQILLVHNQLLEIQRAKKDLTGQITTLSKIADIYKYGFFVKNSNLIQPQKALSIYKKIFEIQQLQKDLDGQALTLLNIGDIYDKLVRHKEALATYKQALWIRQQQKELGWQATILARIGEIYHSQKEEEQERLIFKQVIDTYKQALEMLKIEPKNPSNLRFNIFDRASIFSYMAEAYGKLGDAENTLSYGIQADELRLAEEKDFETRVKKLYAMSDKYSRFGKRQKAIDTLNRAVKIQQENHDIAGQAETLRQIAEIYNNSSETQKALDLLNQVLATQQQRGNRIGQVKTLSTIAGIYRSLGDYTFSKDTNNQALVLAKQTDEFSTQAEILSDIGTVYRDEEQYDKAVSTYLQALEIARAIKDNWKYGLYGPRFEREMAETSVLIGLGWIYSEMRDFSKALTTGNRILELSRSTTFFSGPAYAYTIIGNAYFKQGNYPKALDAFEKALLDFKKYQSPSMDAKVLSLMGEAYVGLNQYEKAIETYNLALVRMQQKWGNRQGEAKILYLIALAERNRGNLNAARTQIEQALKVVEDFRSKLADQQLRTSYFSSVQKYFDFYIDLLMQMNQRQPSQGYDSLAFQASERAKARNLLELLVESQTDIRQGVDPKLLEMEKDLNFKFNVLEKRRLELYGKPTSPKNQKDSIPISKGDIEKEQNVLLSQYRNLEAQIRSSSPRYAALTQPKPLTLPQLHQQILDDQTLLLEYHLGKDRSYLWVISKTGITSYQLPKQAEIEPAVEKFRKAIANSSQTSQLIAQTGKSLSQLLLSPIVKYLGQKRLLIVCNGALQYLPFAALPDPTDNKPLLVNHEIINLPSASTLATLRSELNGRKPAPKTIAMFADPVFSPTDERIAKAKRQSFNSTPQQSSITEPFTVQTLRSASQDAGINFERLRGTRQEAKDILQLLPPQMQTQALDFEANRTNVLKPNLSQYRIVHFATHGILNTTRPALSAVVLSLVDPQGRPQNGFLRLNDIFNLNLPAELVVLSACQTGLGQNIRGEGLVGLTRGFMYAGSPRVLVSLWSVNDESTADLMTRFYKAMLEKGLPPAAALRTAQLELQKQPKWNSPYYWAAFAFQGEWK